MDAFTEKQAKQLMGEIEAIYLFNKSKNADIAAQRAMEKLKSLLLNGSKGNVDEASAYLNTLIDSSPMFRSRREEFQEFLRRGVESKQINELEKAKEEAGMGTDYYKSQFHEDYGNRLLNPAVKGFTYDDLYEYYNKDHKYNDEVMLDAMQQIKERGGFQHGWNGLTTMPSWVDEILANANESYRKKLLEENAGAQGTDTAYDADPLTIKTEAGKAREERAKDENKGVGGIDPTADEGTAETATSVLQKAADLQNAEAAQANAAQQQAYNNYVQNAQAGINRSRAGLLGSQEDSNQTRNVAGQYQANRQLGTSTQADYLEKMATANAAQAQADNMKKNSWMDTASGVLSGMTTFFSDERMKEAPQDTIDDGKLKEAIKQFRQLKKRLEELKRNK